MHATRIALRGIVAGRCFLKPHVKPPITAISHQKSYNYSDFRHGCKIASDHLLAAFIRRAESKKKLEKVIYEDTQTYHSRRFHGWTAFTDDRSRGTAKRKAIQKCDAERVTGATESKWQQHSAI